ncbi:hypothetical protein C8R44DRAFT_979898 [Mycena epipterygia]|nr:hypothetical protein C8R44DRAFT_979898 [Mycena epipterygia]
MIARCTPAVTSTSRVSREPSCLSQIRLQASCCPTPLSLLASHHHLRLFLWYQLHASLASYVSLTVGYFIDAAHGATPGRGREFGCELRVDGSSICFPASSLWTSALLHSLPPSLEPVVFSICESGILSPSLAPFALHQFMHPPPSYLRRTRPTVSTSVAVVPPMCSPLLLFVAPLALAAAQPAPLVIRPLLIVSSNSSLHAFSPSVVVVCRLRRAFRSPRHASAMTRPAGDSFCKVRAPLQAKA